MNAAVRQTSSAERSHARTSSRLSCTPTSCLPRATASPPTEGTCAQTVKASVSADVCCSSREQKEAHRNPATSAGPLSASWGGMQAVEGGRNLPAHNALVRAPCAQLYMDVGRTHRHVAHQQNARLRSRVPSRRGARAASTSPC
eukprot:6203868-Pleurochrysis_carterae.AAC.4